MAAKKKTKKKMTEKQRAALAAKRRRDLLAWSPDKPKKKRCKPCKPGTTRRAAPKRAKAASAPTVTAAAILKNVAARRGKRWMCGGPVRSGCGGSGSRVIGKVR